MQTRLALGLLFALGLASTGCGKSTFEQNIASVGNTMAYDVTGFSVKAGQKVKITLKNNADQPAMTHNWVLVKPGTEQQVATDGIAAGPTANYVKAGDANVIAFTPISQPGGTVDVTFTAPSEPGNYPYICTYPGHWTAMKGTMMVTK